MKRPRGKFFSLQPFIPQVYGLWRDQHDHEERKLRPFPSPKDNFARQTVRITANRWGQFEHREQDQRPTLKRKEGQHLKSDNPS